MDTPPPKPPAINVPAPALPPDAGPIPKLSADEIRSYSMKV